MKRKVRESSMFPETSVTLLGKLAAQVTGEDQANWLRFWNLYANAIRRFAVRIGDENNADDVVSEVMRKLVDFFRAGRLDCEKGSFRSYLAQMIRNELGMIYRKEKVRKMDCRVYLDVHRDSDDEGMSLEAAAAMDAEAEMAQSDDTVWKHLDLEFAAAKRQEALEHIFANPAISEQKKNVYRAYVLEERPIDEVAERFGISRNLVSQIKVRMERTFLAVLAEMGIDG